MAEILMRLKLKYRNPGRLEHRDFDPPQGTLTYKAGRFTSKRGGNAGTGSNTKTLRPRRKAYGPW